MRVVLERFERYAVDVILERKEGGRANALKFVLGVLSLLYGRAVQLRLALYRRRILRPQELGCPVVSIGNLTVGGTGKTPVAEMLARELQKRGRRVAILSRGYKSVPRPFMQRLRHKLFKHLEMFPPRVVSDGKRVLLDSRRAGDEPHMLARNLPGVCVLVDKDRVKSGLHALRHFDTDVILLDDGLQYQRLRHRLDVVLVDRQSPFGNEHLLPRGTLREPPANLRRASFIIITKSAAEPDLGLIARLRRLNRTAAIIECDHAPRYWQDIVSGAQFPLDHLAGRYVGAMSGIARPESFEDAVRHLGAKVEITKSFADHHRFTKKEILRFLEWCDRRSLDALVTTEKDAVRFPDLATPLVPMLFLRVEIEILRGRDEWENLVQRLAGGDG
ncbi:MAG: tetraacyldisaccharide 4'-kinase [Chthoniobacterales bacterium]|jgi:tetraacyldisaccharide 4'-kinase|nr:tetraacyldisaccharide 4'-kinase [Chthoniobacterales bacterium]